MRKTARVVAVVVCLLAPLIALGSGSSVVEAKGKWSFASIESVRKSFAHTPGAPNPEQRWHQQWRERNQPVVDDIGKQLEAELGKADAKAAYRVLPYDEKAAETEPAKGAFRRRYRADDVTVLVTHDQKPTDKQSAALTALVERITKAAKAAQRAREEEAQRNAE